MAARSKRPFGIIAEGTHIHETEDGLYRFVWKTRGVSGYRKELIGLIGDPDEPPTMTTYDVLECNKGSPEYWASVFKDATIDPSQDYAEMQRNSKYQPYECLVTMMFIATQEIVGFCLLRRGKLCEKIDPPQCRVDERSWYVEFVCTSKGKGYGRIFFDEIHRRAMELGKEYITLSALPDVIMFYRNLGYKLTLDLSCMESPEISAIADTVRTEINRRKAVHESLPTSIDEMLLDRPFNELLLASLRENLSAVRLRGSECKDAKDCVEDGIYMIICIPKQRMEIQPRPLYDVLASLPVPAVAINLEDDPRYMDQMESFR